MTKKCIYCGVDVASDRVIDFCDRCGKGVWGEKMFNAIVENMENARDNDNLLSPSFNTNSENIKKDSY